MTASVAETLFSSDPRLREQSAGLYKVFAGPPKIPRQFREDWQELLGDKRLDEGLAWPKDSHVWRIGGGGRNTPLGRPMLPACWSCTDQGWANRKGTRNRCRGSYSSSQGSLSWGAFHMPTTLYSLGATTQAPRGP